MKPRKSFSVPGAHCGRGRYASNGNRGTLMACTPRNSSSIPTTVKSMAKAYSARRAGDRRIEKRTNNSRV